MHDQCNFQFYRQGTIEKTSHYTYVDFTNKILLQFSENPPSVSCYDNIVFQSLEGLWVTHRGAKGKSANILWKPLRSASLHAIFEVTNNYLLFITSRELKNSHTDIESYRCRLQNNDRSNLVHIQDNKFIRNIGDALALLECTTKFVTISTNNSVCYSHIKINEGGFLDASTHYKQLRKGPVRHSYH